MIEKLLEGIKIREAERARVAEIFLILLFHVFAVKSSQFLAWARQLVDPAKSINLQIFNFLNRDALVNKKISCKDFSSRKKYQISLKFRYDHRILLPEDIIYI